MSKIKRLFFVLFLTYASVAQSAEWVSVDTGNGMRTDLDKSSIVRSGPTIRVWLRTVWRQPTRTMPDSPEITEWLGRYVIDCNTRRTSTVQSILSNQGTPVAQTNKPTDFADIVPDTPMERIANGLCSGRK